MKNKNKLGSSGIGGQAVIEGIMMRNKDWYSVAVRKSDNTIEVEKKQYKSASQKNKILRAPFIRGVFSFIDSLVLGIKSLTYSASFFEDEDETEEEPGKLELWLINKFGEKAENVIMGCVVAVSIIFSVLIFMMLPLFIADMFERFVPGIGSRQVPIIEGIAKMVIFIGYMLLISLMKDIRRTFMYHGAEHKCINCIENGKILTVENVRESSRFHKRCGTSFMLIVLIISILFFIFIRSDVVWIKYTIRLILIPVIAGVSYEIIRLAGSSDNFIVNLISKPGIWMQKITTKEPTDDMIEVAIKAVEEVFDWKDYLKSNGIEVLDEISGEEDVN